MTKLKILIRSLLKNKVTSAITIVGFSVSISVALIMIAFLIKEYSYDKDYPNIERIYRVIANANNASVREDFREHFLENYPEIVDACRYNNFNSTLTYGNTPFKGQMIATDSSFFNIFSTQFILGSNHSSLNALNDVVVTESFARKIFGKENPIGKTLVAEYRDLLVVSGVIKDFPENSSIKGDFITNSKLKIIYEGTNDGQGNRVDYFRMFILLKNSHINTLGLEEMLTKDISTIQFKVGYAIKTINLVPFEESYFMQDINRSETSHANLKLIKLLSLITLIIILLAVFNYINLSTATHSSRFQEIGIKKTIGAFRRQIFSQFIIESFAVCFLSFIAALMLSYLWIPTFERFLGSNINMNVLFRPIYLGWLICGVIFISIISGIYPALSISNLKPIVIFRKGEAIKQGTLGLRAILNILQYVVSLSLIIAVIVLSRQIDYVKTKDFGFDADKLLRVDVNWQLINKVNVIRDKLLSYPSIKNASFSHGTPGSIYSTSSLDVLSKSNKEMISELTVDSTFFEVFRIPVIQGRQLLPSDFNKVCYLNEKAFQKTGWDSFVGKRYHGLEIIGIVKDFNFASLYSPITPLVIQISSSMGISHLTLRVSPGNIPQTINALKETWKEVCPGHELKYQFYDQWLDSMYKGEERLAASIRLFAILAIIISCLGILGLAEFSIKKRIKEIGIRKVNGAKISEIIVMLNKDFVKWVAIAFVIATPIAWYFMNKWLENFAYKTTLSWWIFALSGLLALGIALLTVSWQSWKAATRNPVEALRYE